MNNLAFLRQSLLDKLRSGRGKQCRYHVPRSWSLHPENLPPLVQTDPFEFYLAAVDEIVRMNSPLVRQPDNGDWTREAVIYNMFVRTTCAFDHDQTGTLETPQNADGFRETGTFLKAIALLPYVKRLGANTVHLLPVTAIGMDGRKGSLGAPYAIKNPFKLDETLAEPALGVGPDVEFAAFVEAAHLLGIRVVMEFVFRTAARDSDWIPEHPEWFYWIRADIPDRQPGSNDESAFGPPIFSDEQLTAIKDAVDRERFDELLAPGQSYRAMFTHPPRKETIVNEDGRWIGYLDDGTRVRVPGAFADWPPDDIQPPWNDVTYLKLYDHPDFNYVSYNTVRMYDSKLARAEYVQSDLWQRIIGIIPHYQTKFNIDGVMIDMGHALPEELTKAIVKEARSINPSFAFWDENFSVTMKSREAGYNAAVGFCWSVHHDVVKFRSLLRMSAQDGFPLPFFATPETHNTPRAATRAGGIAYARACWLVDNFMPAIPFIHSGFELGETHPINTGLGFTNDEIRRFPVNGLPLFNEFAYDWLREGHIIEWVARISELRVPFADLITDLDPSTCIVVDTGNDRMIAFMRASATSQKTILVVANFDFANEQRANIDIGRKSLGFTDLLRGATFEAAKGELRLVLAPGECLLLLPH